jgi:hypothetical protein
VAQKVHGQKLSKNAKRASSRRPGQQTNAVEIWLIELWEGCSAMLPQRSTIKPFIAQKYSSLEEPNFSAKKARCQNNR